MTTILVINDDGIHSIGLIILRKQLEKLENITVVAPKDERSGNGKALTTDHIKIIKTEHRDGSEACSLTKRSIENSLRLIAYE